MNHTPTPWKAQPITRNHVATSRDFVELHADRGPVGVYIFCPPGFDGGTYEIEESNAAFIVQAVNLHEELVGALEAMLAAENELMIEFVSKKRAAKWGIINDAGVKAAKALSKAKED